jgi:hypothetical protein
MSASAIRNPGNTQALQRLCLLTLGLNRYNPIRIQDALALYLLFRFSVKFTHTDFGQKHGGHMADEDNSTGNNLIWAVTLIIIVALIAGALYYSGFLGGSKSQKIDVDVSAPAR